VTCQRGHNEASTLIKHAVTNKVVWFYNQRAGAEKLTKMPGWRRIPLAMLAYNLIACDALQSGSHRYAPVAEAHHTGDGAIALSFHSGKETRSNRRSRRCD
jgi:hypothetical protein